jgi:alpha-tubulin suppressor-like RCC1 family protein
VKVTGLSGVTAISAGYYHSVALKNDGTVVTVGYNKQGQRSTDGWRDIVAVSVGENNTVGLKADGTVVAVGDNSKGQCNTSGWRSIGPVNKEQIKERMEAEKRRQAEEEQRHYEQVKRWEQQGLCRHCGGQLGGLFTKKCKSCGREK